MFYAERDHNGHSTHTMIHSLSAHVFIVLLLAIPFLNYLIDPGPPKLPSWSVQVFWPADPLKPLPAKPVQNRGGGSGGDRSLEEATTGKIPPFAWKQFAPPANRKDHSALEVPPTVIGPPGIPSPNSLLLNWGDPTSKFMTEKGGRGSRDGFGENCCGGVGKGKRGRGVGDGEEWGTGDGPPKAGTNRTTTPECTYCPSPIFTAEAIKAKFQGTVTLRLVVTADGRATNIVIVQGPGLGLDQAALETVRNWHFRAALGPDHKPAATWITVEVNFRQL